MACLRSIRAVTSMPWPGPRSGGLWPERLVGPMIVVVPGVLLPGKLAPGDGDLVLASVAAMHVDHRGPGAAVSHSIHQLTQGCPGASGEYALLPWT
jgi:hypothetical protein